MASTLHLYTYGTDPFTVDLGDVSLVIHAGAPPEVPPATQPGPGPVKGPNPTKPFKPTPKKPTWGAMDAPTRVADLSGILDKLPKSTRTIGMTVGSASRPSPPSSGSR